MGTRGILKPHCICCVHTEQAARASQGIPFSCLMILKHFHRIFIILVRYSRRSTKFRGGDRFPVADVDLWQVTSSPCVLLSSPTEQTCCDGPGALSDSGTGK